MGILNDIKRNLAAQNQPVVCPTPIQSEKFLGAGSSVVQIVRVPYLRDGLGTTDFLVTLPTDIDTIYYPAFGEQPQVGISFVPCGVNLSQTSVADSRYLFQLVPRTTLQFRGKFNQFYVSVKGINRGGTLVLLAVDGMKQQFNFNEQETTVYQDTFAAANIAVPTAVGSTNIQFALQNVDGANAVRIAMVRRVEISFTKSAAGMLQVCLLKNSSQSTGGTPSLIAGVPYDSKNIGGPEWQMKAFNTAPTPGTLIGAVRASIQPGNAATTATQSLYEYRFGDGDEQPLILRGTEELAIEFIGTTTGLNAYCSIEWGEL